MKEGLFEKNMSLSEMDAVLEHFLAKEGSAIRILVDIPLTEEEYILLSDKLISMKRNMATMQRYRISMLLAWAYALYYGKEESREYCEIMSKLDEMPQHFTRQFFRICSRTFEEFGLNTYFKEICSKQQLCGMMVAQAGISEEMAPHFCRLLEELIEGKSIREAMDEMGMTNNEHLEDVANASSYYFLENLLLSAKEMMRDCQSGHYTEPEIREKYNITSSRLIHTCWCWVQERNRACA
ncbi:MAG: hypothetical protein K2N63_09240 [Lachnospiraceae bacterium]|nr:hypothetical protein [Lachnospiraceae bacterium]